MSSGPRLESSIKKHFAPVLRVDGFAGSGRTFRRVLGDLIQVVNVQGSRYGGRFAVNMGIQPLCIPDVVGDTPDPKKISEPSCEFRRRLSESGRDQWWEHDAAKESMDAAVKAAAAVYCVKGRPILNAFAGPMSPLMKTTPEAYESGQFDFHGFGSTNVRMALALARYRKARGDVAAAKRFASIGLASVGSGLALLNELRDLAS